MARARAAHAPARPARPGLPAGFPRRDLIMALAGSLALDPRIERVWLFGSRARGDAFERSDIDLAVEAPELPDDAWTRLHLDFPEDAPTLLMIDLVRLDRADASLRSQVQDEGILLHERPGARRA